MVDVPERIWTMGSGRYAFDEPHMRDGVAATEYVRVDLLVGPCGYLHMPIGLAEDSWSLADDPSEYPDEVASAPLYLIDPALSDAVAEREAEPVAVRYGWDGHGFQYMDSGSGSDYLTRHPDGEPLYAAPVELEALRKRVAELEKALDGLLDLAPENLTCGSRCQLETTQTDEDEYRSALSSARRVREGGKVDG